MGRLRRLLPALWLLVNGVKGRTLRRTGFEGRGLRLVRSLGVCRPTPACPRRFVWRTMRPSGGHEHSLAHRTSSFLARLSPAPSRQREVNEVNEVKHGGGPLRALRCRDRCPSFRGHGSPTLAPRRAAWLRGGRRFDSGPAHRFRDRHRRGKGYLRAAKAASKPTSRRRSRTMRASGAARRTWPSATSLKAVQRSSPCPIDAPFDDPGTA